jgi:hypothetical protein
MWFRRRLRGKELKQDFSQIACIFTADVMGTFECMNCFPDDSEKVSVDVC